MPNGRISFYVYTKGNKETKSTEKEAKDAFSKSKEGDCIIFWVKVNISIKIIKSMF